MSVVGITDLWAYVIGCVAIILLPGPNSLFVMSTAALADRRRAASAMAGVLVADTVFIVGSGLGLVALLRALPWLFDALRWIGGAYLVWLGLLLLASAWREHRTPKPATPEPAREAQVFEQDVGPARARIAGHDPAMDAAARATARAGLARTFRKALAIGLLNPKAMMFYVAFFPQFVDPATGNWLTFVVMGCILQLCSFVYLLALVYGGSSLAAAARRSAWLGALGRSATGVLFIAFGARLAAARSLQ